MSLRTLCGAWRAKMALDTCMFRRLRGSHTSHVNFSVVNYLMIRPETQAELSNLDTARPAVRLLPRFIADESLRVRLKV